MHILSVVGTRPNFTKIAPFIRALDARLPRPFRHTLVHSGQHYDPQMSGSFFGELGIPAPDVNLGIGSGSHAEQVGRTMIAFETELLRARPDWVVVVGDVNATCACSITARKHHVPVAHIEAGIRSFDESMPEEINRIVTDRVSNLLLTPDEIADANLAREGADPARIRRVGNIMIDTLDENHGAAAALGLATVLADHALVQRPDGLADGDEASYAALTLHRPSNVDHREPLAGLVDFLLDEVAATMPVVWTVHPRTRKQLETFGLWERVAACARMVLLAPLGYREMLRLNMGARIMLTDSGGLQEECCVLGTPCVTLRENTERPATLEEHGGTCVLAGNRVDAVRAAFVRLRDRPRLPFRPPLWDGHAAGRIAEVFAALG